MMNTNPLHARALAVIVLLAALPAGAQVADGDHHYAIRAEGAQGDHAVAEHIDAAIAAYQRAVAASPNDVVAHGRLLRAYRFKGAYVARTNEEKKRIYGTAKDAGEKALQLVNRLLASKGVKENAPEKAVSDAARTIPGAADVFLWDAVNWGEWALAYGKLAAARQGAADRIRRDATIAFMIDPRLEAGSPPRVLGRLHDQTPRIPFLTGWASSKEAVRFLNESLKIDPANKLTLVFLAEAMVSNDSSSKPKAIELLRKAVSTPNNPQLLIEDTAAAEDAKTLLKKWGAA
jgi:tetratricopeptide (TPR) repeat protein